MKKPYEQRLKEWNTLRQLVRDYNKHLIDEYYALPWWKRLFIENPRQKVLDNWSRFSRYPTPRMEFEFKF